jgi:hypothetical protein
MTGLSGYWMLVIFVIRGPYGKAAYLVLEVGVPELVEFGAHLLQFLLRRADLHYGISHGEWGNSVENVP